MIPFLNTAIWLISIAASTALWPLMKSRVQQAVLLLAVFFVIWLLHILIENKEQESTIQGHAEARGISSSASSKTLADIAKQFLGFQTPRRVSEMPDMLSPKGTIMATYVARNVEGRKVFGRKYLVDFKKNNNTNRLALYFETMNKSNYLVLEIRTFDSKKYIEKVKIDHWKDNKLYPIFVTWDNDTKEVNLYGGEGQLSAHFKTESKIFEQTGIKAYIY